MALQGLAAAAAGEHDKRRQILVFASQAVSEPGAHRRPPGLLVARAHEGHSRVVIDWLGEHRTNDRDVVGNAADVWNHAAEFNATFAVPFELVRRTDTPQDRLPRGHAGDPLSLANTRRQFLAGHFFQLWFWIEQVQMR